MVEGIVDNDAELVLLPVVAAPDGGGDGGVQAQGLVHHHVQVGEALHHRVGGELLLSLLKRLVHLLLQLGLHVRVPRDHN